jgi:hypothetical protein
MPDKKREEGFVKIFIRQFNSDTGKHYQFAGRPEEDSKMEGHYDFLYSDKHTADDYLAIEENSLNKSSVYGRDNKEIHEIQSEVDRILKEKGIVSPTKGYQFFLKLKNAPPKKNRREYADRLAQCIEKVITENNDLTSRQDLHRQLKGCDLAQEFWVIRNKAGSGNRLYCTTDEFSSQDLRVAVRDALVTMFRDCDAKLKVAKELGYKTVLLITSDWDDLVITDSGNVIDAMSSVEANYHEHIDEMFFVSKKSFESGYAINKIK